MRRSAVWLLLWLLSACAGDASPVAPPTNGPAADGAVAPVAPDADLGRAADDASDSGPAWPQLDPAEVQQRFEKLVAFASARMKQDGVPGAAVAVLVGGKLAHVQGIGLRQKGGSAPVTADSLFALASVSKLFAGITAAALAEKGVVDLQRPVSAYFPQINFSDPATASQITLHHLLTHTSGMGFADDDLLYALPIDWTAPESMVQIFTQVQWPNWAPPGAVWNYNNAGYSLAGAVLQQASKVGYSQLVESEVLAPLGMASATLDPARIKAADHTYGHSSYEPNPVAPFTSGLIDYFSGPSNWVFCSARELARVAELILAGGGTPPLTAAAVKAISTRHASLEHLFPGDAYGYGLEWSARQGVETLGHSGSNFGWTADFVLVPSQGLGVIALMNSGEGNPFAVTDEGLRLLATPAGASADPPPLSATQLAALAGTYGDAGALGDVQVKAAASGAALQATFPKWGATVTLQQYGVRAFYGELGAKMSQALWGMPGLDVAFYLDGSGQGEYLVSRLGVGRRQ